MAFIGPPHNFNPSSTIHRRASCLRSRWNTVWPDLLRLSSVAGVRDLSILDGWWLRLCSRLLLELLLCLAWPLCHFLRYARRNIQTPINALGDGLNLRSEFLFNSIQIEPVLVCNKIDGKTQVSESPCATSTMKIRFAVLRKVKIDDDVYSLYIDSTGKKIRADKVAAYAVAEIMENTITMGL